MANGRRGRAQIAVSDPSVCAQEKRAAMPSVLVIVIVPAPVSVLYGVVMDGIEVGYVHPSELDSTALTCWLQGDGTTPPSGQLRLLDDLAVPSHDAM